MAEKKPVEPKQNPLNRMLLFIGQKMETLELCYSTPPAAPGEARAWSSEMAQEEWKIYGEIHQTLTLVRAFEPAVRAVIKDRLKGQRFNGGSNVETDYRRPVAAAAEGRE